MLMLSCLVSEFKFLFWMILNQVVCRCSYQIWYNACSIQVFLGLYWFSWATGALSGKFVGTFFSTASQHGGQETTAYTLLTYFAHHGLNYVPLGFANAHLFDNSEVVGGSAYGAGTVGK